METDSPTNGVSVSISNSKMSSSVRDMWFFVVVKDCVIVEEEVESKSK